MQLKLGQVSSINTGKGSFAKPPIAFVVTTLFTMIIYIVGRQKYYIAQSPISVNISNIDYTLRQIQDDTSAEYDLYIPAVIDDYRIQLDLTEQPDTVTPAPEKIWTDVPHRPCATMEPETSVVVTVTRTPHPAASLPQDNRLAMCEVREEITTLSSKVIDKVIKTRYNSFGNPVSAKTYSSDDDSIEASTEWLYDDENQLYKISDDYDADGKADMISDIYYNNQNQVYMIIYTYNGIDTIHNAVYREYDESGILRYIKIDEHLDGVYEDIRRFEYYDINHTKSECASYDNGLSIDSCVLYRWCNDRIMTEIDYNINDNEIRNRIEYYYYDANVIRIERGFNEDDVPMYTIKYNYNAKSLVSSIENLEFEIVRSRITYEYDSLDRLSRSSEWFIEGMTIDRELSYECE